MSLFDKLFKKEPQPHTVERAELINNSTAVFTPWSGDAYANDIYRGAVDAIARNGAKLKGNHIIKYPDRNEYGSMPELDRLLQVQPNPYMSAYDLIYKVFTHYFLYNNAFLYLQRDQAGRLIGIYPIRANNVEFLADPTETLYCRFLFENGKQVTLPYADVIHLRRNFNENDLLGDPNNALIPALELAHTQNEGIINGIKSSANIRGILKFTQIMNSEKLKEEKDAFVADYLQIANNGGVVATDSKMEYTPLEMKPATIDEKQIQAVKTKIYDYLGISENIVNSSYKEDEWGAFFESTLEPIAVQLSLEFTRKIFTEREQLFGNSIMFDSGRLQFSSYSTKIKLIQTLMPYGILSINQSLQILNLPGVEGGDRRLQTLNVVDAAKANKYQVGEENSTEGGDL